MLAIMFLSGIFSTAKENLLSLVRPTGEEKLLRDLLRENKKKRDDDEAKRKLKELLGQLNSSVGSPNELKSGTNAAVNRQQPGPSATQSVAQ